jgi:hypothetical protein
MEASSASDVSSIPVKTKVKTCAIEWIMAANAHESCVEAKIFMLLAPGRELSGSAFPKGWTPSPIPAERRTPLPPLGLGTYPSEPCGFGGEREERLAQIRF